MTREEFLALPEVSVFTYEETKLADGSTVRRVKMNGPGCRAVFEDDIIERCEFDGRRWTIYRDTDGRVVRRCEGFA